MIFSIPALILLGSSLTLDTSDPLAWAPLPSLSEPAPVVSPFWTADEEKSGSPFSYTYIEIGAATLNVDDLQGSGEDVDSYYLRAQLALFGFLYIYGGYEAQDSNFQSTDSDLYRLGLGAHFNVFKKLDIVGEANYIRNDVSSNLPNIDDSTDGVEAYAGARWMPLQWDGGGLEIDGGAVWVDVKNRLASSDDAFGGKAGARLHFLRLFSVGVEYALLDNDDQLLGSLRASF